MSSSSSSLSSVPSLSESSESQPSTNFLNEKPSSSQILIGSTFPTADGSSLPSRSSGNRISSSNASASLYHKCFGNALASLSSCEYCHLFQGSRSKIGFL